MNTRIIRAYDRILKSCKLLQESMTELIQASGARHRDIWSAIGIKKDTFYRRMRLQDWTWQEMRNMVPFLIKKVKINDPILYQELTDTTLLDELD